MSDGCPRCGYVAPDTVHLEVTIGRHPRSIPGPACGSLKRDPSMTTDPALVTCGRCLRTALYAEVVA